MMRLAEIQAHIGGMSELRDIVGAMRLSPPCGCKRRNMHFAAFAVTRK